MIVSFNGMSVNRIKTEHQDQPYELSYDLSYVVISLAKLKESFQINSLRLSGSSIRIKNLAKLYPGVFIADRISRNFSKLLTTGLWILGLPQSIHGL